MGVEPFEDGVKVTDEMKAELIRGLAEELAGQFVAVEVLTDRIMKNGKTYKKGDKLLMHTRTAEGFKALGEVKIIKGK